METLSGGGTTLAIAPRPHGTSTVHLPIFTGWYDDPPGRWSHRSTAPSHCGSGFPTIHTLEWDRDVARRLGIDAAPLPGFVDSRADSHWKPGFIATSGSFPGTVPGVMDHQPRAGEMTDILGGDLGVVSQADRHNHHILKTDHPALGPKNLPHLRFHGVLAPCLL